MSIGRYPTSDQTMRRHPAKRRVYAIGCLCIAIAVAAACLSVYLLRRDQEKEAEFMTITLFESLDAVRRFAGENYETAVLHPKAHALLSRYDARSEHYEIRIAPE